MAYNRHAARHPLDPWNDDNVGSRPELWALERIGVLMRTGGNWHPSYQYRVAWCAADYARRCEAWFITGLEMLVREYESDAATRGWANGLIGVEPDWFSLRAMDMPDT